MTQLTSALDELWQNLTTYKIVAGTRPGISVLDSPWYVKTLLAFSGWVAAIFLMGFVGAVFAFAFKYALVSCFLGCVLIGIAYYFLSRPKNEFLAHLALAISLAGQGLIAWGVLEPLHRSVPLCALIIGAMHLLLTVIMPNFIHRVFSSFSAACALYVGFVFSASSGYHFSPTAEATVIAFIAYVMSWLWINEFRFSNKLSLTCAAGYGSTLALLVLKSISVFGVYMHAGVLIKADSNLILRGWLGEILLVAVLMWVVIHILHGMKNAPTRVIPIALGGALVIGLMSIKAPGITIGMLIMLLGFHSRNRVLSALGIVALIGYTSRYYYFLDQTLAAKAGTLLILGFVLLVVRFSLIRTANAKTVNPGVR